ncbi:MAG: nucleotide exchange factor GrpE [Propionibacteriaceae bacterium]|jgi:molecular chaperone GrpE|nr:nucleotide exchange factor GrpE [Propionibacteriaceae bacterium]
MTDKTVPSPDWDKELQDLVESVDADDQAETADESGQTATDQTTPAGVDEGAPAQPDADLAELLAERTLDLQRLQAEYVNYKRRVDRDRDVARQRGIEAVVGDLLPVLDGIDAAKSHDELTGGAKMLADELEKVATKYGLVEYGAEGDPFDPHIHEALMHMDKPGYPVTSVAQVFQKGYLIGDRVIRPARVGVADADDSVLDQAVSAVDPSADAGQASPQAANDPVQADQSRSDQAGPEQVGPVDTTASSAEGAAPETDASSIEGAASEAGASRNEDATGNPQGADIA